METVSFIQSIPILFKEFRNNFYTKGRAVQLISPAFLSPFLPSLKRLLRMLEKQNYPISFQMPSTSMFLTILVITFLHDKSHNAFFNNTLFRKFLLRQALFSGRVHYQAGQCRGHGRQPDAL